jgi:ferredoxin-thioredoxin reductase catalytic subunit
MNEMQKLAIEGLRRNFEIYKKPYCPCLNPALFSQPNHEDYICKCKEYRDGRGCHCGLHT